MVWSDDTEDTGKSSFHFRDAGSDLWQVKEKNLSIKDDVLQSNYMFL